MNSVASSAVFGLVAVPPMAVCATPNHKDGYVDRAVCQRGAARRREEVLQRIEQRLKPPQPGEQQILQSCRFRDSDRFVEGPMLAPSINDEVLLTEERP
jgi:hypothetical protein